MEFFSAEPWQLDGTHLDQPIKIWNRRKCDELPWHVIKGGLGADALLLDPEFLEAKANCGLISDLADDFRRNFEKAREYEFRISRRLRKGTGGGLWSGRYEQPASVPMRRLRYIEEALRREASFLQRHPESLFAVLWNVLHWRDQPGLNQHCERQFHPSDRPPNLGLATWLEAWRDRRLQSEATNTWLQAVRPLPRPIGTADRTLFHGAPVTHLAAVPLRRAFVSAGDNVLRIWNADTGAELASLVIAGARSARDPFLRDVFALTVGDAWNWDEVARRGEQENPDLIRQPAEGDGRSVFDSPLPHISCIAAATEAKQVAVGFGKDVCVIDAASGETVHRFGCEKDVTSIAFSGDDSSLAACDGSPTVLLWDLKTGKLAKRLVGKHDYYRVGFVPRFQVLYAVCQWWENDRPPTDFWNLVTGDLSTSLAAPFASFSLDGARMLYAYPGLEVDGGGSNARVGNWQKDGALSEPISHPTNIQLKRGPIALSADGSMIAAASDDDSTLDLIEVVSGGVLPRRPGHRIRALTFIDTADKDTYDDMLINRMDDYVEDRLQQSVHKLQPEWVGEPMVVSASDDGSICLTATTRFRPEPRWPVQHEDSIDHVEFTRDGLWLISVSWGSVRTWHADTGIPHLRLEPGGHLATCTPDSKAVAVEWREKAVKVLSLEDGALLHTIETGPILCLTHSADGKLMLAGDEQGRVRGWRPSTFEEVGTIASVEKPVHGLSLSPDNTMLGICSDDQEVRLYEVATGKLVRQFSARPPSESSSIAFNASALAFSRFDGQDVVVVLDQMVGELNYWQLDGTYLGCNQGLGDIRACSEGYPWLALYNRNAGELSVRRARNSDRVAYWPSPRISRIATHPNGHVFAAAEGGNLLILRLEQPPADA